MYNDVINVDIIEDKLELFEASTYHSEASTFRDRMPSPDKKCSVGKHIIRIPYSP